MNYKYSDYYPDYLMHFGIPGMKWGTKNGPPYPLEKAKKSAAEIKKKYSEKYKKSDDYKEARAKSARQMTDAELNKAISRLKRENEYNDLRHPKTKFGKDIAKDVLSNSGKKAITAFVTAAGVTVGSAFIAKYFAKRGIDIDSDKYRDFFQVVMSHFKKK